MRKKVLKFQLSKIRDSMVSFQADPKLGHLYICNLFLEELVETLFQLGGLHFSLNRVRPLLPLCPLYEYKDPIFSLTQNTEQKIVARLPCVMGIY